VRNRKIVLYSENYEISRRIEPMARPCKICSSSEMTRIAGEMAAAGRTDKDVAAAVGVSLASANRHRINHLRPVAKALADVVDRGVQPREQIKQTLIAAEQGKIDPASFLSVAQITSDLRSAAERLERAASTAEQGGQLSVIPPLVAQQHRNVELRGRVSGLPAFVPAKLAPGEGSQLPSFNLIINMPNGVQERISGTPEAPDGPSPPVLDVLDFRVEVPVEQPAVDPGIELGKLFGAKG
jgi:hypothetical protein